MTTGEDFPKADPLFKAIDSTLNKDEVEWYSNIESIVPVSSTELIDNQESIECRFTLKRPRDTITTYSQYKIHPNNAYHYMCCKKKYKKFPALESTLLSRQEVKIKVWIKQVQNFPRTFNAPENPVRMYLRNCIFVSSHLHHQYLQRIIYENKPSKICGGQPVKNFTSSILEYFVQVIP